MTKAVLNVIRNGPPTNIFRMTPYPGHGVYEILEISHLYGLNALDKSLFHKYREPGLASCTIGTIPQKCLEVCSNTL